jgi:hypothetical protein
MVIVHLTIAKFILALNLGLTKPQHNHMLALIHGIILCEGRKNITQIPLLKNSNNPYFFEYILAIELRATAPTKMTPWKIY